MILKIQDWLIESANKIAVEYFVAIGSAVEEIIAPIPSPIIMTISGSIAQAQLKPVIYLGVLALIGSISKTFASWIVYFIADKAEDILITKFGKMIGVTHKEVEKIGQYFSGTNKDILVMALARAIPVIPTAPVSLVSGIIKLDIKTYLIGTGIGTFFRNIAYLLLGYYGSSSAQNVLNGLDSIESVVQLLLIALAGSLLLLMFYRRKKQTDLWGSIKKFITRK